MLWPTLAMALPGLVALLNLAASASAQDVPLGAEKPRAQVELIVPNRVVTPGSTVPIGVRFTMEPEWHIYWSNPGDAGQPPTFAWTLPGGGAASAMRGGAWSATQPAFPTPIRFTDDGGLIGYGYDGSVIFPAELKIPANATPGQQAEVSLLVQYLVCKDICLAETAVASASITVGTGADDDAAHRDTLAAAIERLPVDIESDRFLRDATVALVPDAPGVRRLTVDLRGPAEDVDLFPNPPAGIAVEDVQVDAQPGRLTATFRVRRYAGARVEETQFPLVIGYTAAGQRRGVVIAVPVGDAADE